VKAHFYPFTGQVSPVPVGMLVSLGVPASAVDALVRRGIVRAGSEGVKGGSRD